MVRPSGDGSLKPQQGAGPLSQSDASSDVVRDQSVVRNARHNAAIAWIRLPISLVVSGFLFIFTTSAIGLAWLGALLVIELFAWGVRKRLVAGDLRFRMPHLAAICLVSLAWVALGLLLWGSGHEVARIASLVALFSVAFYGVAGGYKSRPVMIVLVAPPLLAIVVILTGLAWTSLPFGPALLTTFATLGACATVTFTAMALHRSDRDLEAANADLRSLTHRLTLAAEREREANKAKDALLADVSHEIRTPLNGIVGLAATLDTDALSARDKRSVEVIRQSGDMLERLVSDVLAAAALGSGKIHIQANRFDLANLMESATLLMAAVARSRGLSLTLSVCPATPRRVLGDDVRIRQIVLNLLSNAIKYTERGGVTLSVGLADPGIKATAGENVAPRLRLRVSDTRPGLDPASQDRLFERFERGQTFEEDADGGLGLGLAITQALVDALGGEIHVSSSSTTGSVFEVLIPLSHVPPQDEEDVGTGPAPPPSSPFADRDQPLRVLLVEDHPINRVVVTTMLDALGAITTIAVNGREAVDAASRDRFDLILMDLLMPVMDGLDATRAIRLHETESGRPPCAIVMLTASALPSQARTAKEAGCDSLLTKPVTPERLVDTIAMVMPSNRAEQVRSLNS
jgi:signal transduction histidine kinase/AmiR/NasT family two-component response regulator